MPLLAHIGVGLMAKKALPKIPLWALLVCAMGPDIIAGFLFFTPIWTSHGVFMGIIWSIFSAIITFLILIITSKKKIDNKEKNSIKPDKIPLTSILIGLLVFSHIFLDFVGWPMSVIDPTRITGIPIFFDVTQTIGLGVYKTWFGALSMEFGFLIIGIIVYRVTLKKLSQIE